MRTASISSTDIAVAASPVCVVALLVQGAAAVCAEKKTGEQADLVKAIGTPALLPELLHALPCLNINDGLMMILEDNLLLNTDTRRGGT